MRPLRERTHSVIRRGLQPAGHRYSGDFVFFGRKCRRNRPAVPFVYPPLVENDPPKGSLRAERGRRMLFSSWQDRYRMRWERFYTYVRTTPCSVAECRDDAVFFTAPPVRNLLESPGSGFGKPSYGAGPVSCVSLRAADRPVWGAGRWLRGC